MNEFIEVINKNLPRFIDVLCIVKKDGACSQSGEVTLKEFEVNQNSELIIKIKEIEKFYYEINLAEMYNYEVKEDKIIFYLDNGDDFSIEKKI
jgi:hypothetical protein